MSDKELYERLQRSSSGRSAMDMADSCWYYAYEKHQQGDRQGSLELYKECYEIRRSVLGEDNWLTALAKREIAVDSYLYTRNEDDRKFLVSFVDRIESGYYEFEDDYLDFAKLAEGKTLYILLQDINQIDDFDEYRRLLSLFEPIAVKYDCTEDPLLKIRLYKNLLGGYYFKTGDYIQAEIAFNDALNAKIAPEIPEIITELQIKTNLLLIYYAQNDFEMASTVLPELLDAISNDELSLKDTYRVFVFMLDLYAQSIVELDNDDLNLLREDAMNACRGILDSDSEIEGCICDAASYLCNCITQLSVRKSITKSELRTCMEALEMVSRKALSAMSTAQQVVLLYILALLSCEFDDKKVDQYFCKVAKLLEDDNVPMSIRGEVLQSAGAYYCKTGNHDIGIRYVNQALQEIESTWQSYIRYLNDERLLQILSPTQVLFMNCYSTLRQFQNVISSYENALRFKALASLAGRERNRLLHQSKMNSDLTKEIRTLQDRLSALENAGTFSDTEAATAEVKTKLRKLEAEFAEQFPNQNQVTEITWEKVKEVIPDNCVVIEYFYCSMSYGQTPFDLLDETVDTGIDVYITQKRNNMCTLNKITINDGDSVILDAEEFVSIIQEKSATPKQKFKLEKLRKSLYDRLIQPIMSYVEDFKTVYIAPDSSLVNLPFEILYGDECLSDKHSVIRIECARDFLYSGDASEATNGELIIGNPKYDVRSREIKEETRDSSKHEDTRFSTTPSTKQLPFAEIEARRISKRSGYESYIGIFAKKNLLLNASGYRNIHIATHGMFDLSQSTNSMFSSYLLFAGADNWFKTGNVDGLYGNGIVTADEISRLDLSATELVVLSSCLSGMNDISLSKGFHGMISAFSAAGVHYVISHLWKATDFSTAVLMDEFYRQYLENKKSPPEALSIAKEYLRNVTIRDLRRSHWFDDIRKEDMDSKTEETVAGYEKMDDTRKPFRDETYWGGFSCYQCY